MTRGAESAAVRPGIALTVTEAQLQTLAEAVGARYVDRLIVANRGAVPAGPAGEAMRTRYGHLVEEAQELGFASEFEIAVFVLACERLGDGFATRDDAAGRLVSARPMPAALRAERLAVLLDGVTASAAGEGPGDRASDGVSERVSAEADV